MRTVQKDSLTKQKLLDAAQGLMLAKGYTATSVDDICTAAGLTKGSFFHYFEGKEELGMALAEHYFAAKREMFRSAPFRQVKDPRERVFGYVDFLIGMASNPEAAKGCLLGTFVQELSHTHPKIRSACAACLEEQAEALREDLQLAKSAYGSRARWRPETLALHMLAVVQGALILAKARQDPKVVGATLLHLKEYLNCLLGD